MASLRLFGSVAREEATKTSDVDLLVEFNWTTGYFGLVRLQLFLQEALRLKVDLAHQLACDRPCESGFCRRPSVSLKPVVVWAVLHPTGLDFHVVLGQFAHFQASFMMKRLDD
jgi:Nucleotidyltransferase domain